MEILDERAGLIRQAKRSFSRLGIAGVVMMAVLLAVQTVFAMLGEWLPDVEFFRSDLYSALTNTIPMYIVAMPVAALMMLGMRRNVPERNSMTFKRFLGYFLVGWFLMEAGAIVSNIAGMLIDGVTGTSSSDVINEALETMTLAETAISLCVLAPIGEEIIFRKLIVDRARVFGEGPAIFISALMFSLFHTNIDQFVYAFLLGAFFAFIYQRHGNIWHTILLHAAVNLMGGLIPTLLERIQAPEIAFPDVIGQGEPMELASGIDLESLELGTLPMLIYSAVAMGLAAWGIVLFIKNIRKVKLMPVENGLRKGEYVRVMLRNPGMIIYMVVTLALTVFVYVSMMQL